MLNILVVDDEKYIRKGLAVTIKEAGSQFVICGEAGNGREALSLIEKHRPDVVITDIKMPRMDGIELVEALNESYPKIRKIILSGFDEFDYVRKSMKSGALDYLLKPVDEEHVKKVLCDIEEEIEEEKKKDSDEIKEKNRINESLKIIKNKFLIDLVGGKTFTSDDNTKKKLEQFSLPVEAGNYFIIIISIDNYDFLLNQMPDEAAEKLSALQETVKLLNDNKKIVSSFIYNNEIIVLGALNNANETKLDLAEYILEILPKSIKKEVSLGIGGSVTKIIELNSSYKNATKNLRRRFYKFNKKIFEEADKSQDFAFLKSQDYYELIIEKTKEYFYANKITFFKSSLNALAQDFADNTIHPNEALNILTKIYLKIEAESKVFSLICSDMYGMDFSYTDALKRFDCFKPAIEFSCKYYNDIFDKMLECNSEKNMKVIELVKKYILNNYKENLTLGKVAEVAYINPNYLSEIFKCKTGENFVEYITRIRIEKAKKLLSKLEYKTYQVGQMVGYEDPSYFSKVFKKTVGISPSEYRDKRV